VAQSGAEQQADREAETCLPSHITLATFLYRSTIGDLNTYFSIGSIELWASACKY